MTGFGVISVGASLVCVGQKKVTIPGTLSVSWTAVGGHFIFLPKHWLIDEGHGFGLYRSIVYLQRSMSTVRYEKGLGTFKLDEIGNECLYPLNHCNSILIAVLSPVTVRSLVADLGPGSYLLLLRHVVCTHLG